MNFTHYKGSDDKILGISLEYTRSDQKCEDGDGNYGIKINVECDGDLGSTDVSNLKFRQENDCEQVI